MALDFANNNIKSPPPPPVLDLQDDLQDVLQDEDECSFQDDHQDECVGGGEEDDDSVTLTESDVSGSGNVRLSPMSHASHDTSMHTEASPSSDSKSKDSLFMLREATELETEQAQQLVFSQHPFNQVKKIVSRMQRVKSCVDVDKAACEHDIRHFLTNLIALPSCYNKRRLNFVKCSCIKRLENKDRAVVYLTTVATMTKKQQDALFKELINGRRHRSAGYNIRIGDDKSKGYSFYVCMNSFLNLMALGKKRFRKLNETRLVPGANVHKNTGNCNASMLDETMKAVISFIKQKGKDDGEVYATRIIRSLTKQELRDEEKGGVDLPSSTTKRELYEKFCFDRGWAIKSDNNGRYPRLNDYTNRMADDMFWPADAETSEVCSWFSFRKLWKEHCGNIRIRRPCNDTCGECTIYRNAFRYKETRKKTRDEDEDEDSDDDDSASDDNAEEEEAAAEAVSHFFKDDGIIDDIAKSFLTEDCLDQERILEAAGHHVLQAKGMRYYIQKATEAAVLCRSLEVVHKDREYVIVCDYAQNMPLPHYGGEQPGEIYYFSPLTINLFGIVDLSLSPNKLNCYAYREFTAKKGSNNVASLLMRDLYDRFWLRKGDPGKKLTIAMDNCGGQNKNNVVLRLAPYLVEMGYFKTVEFCFYVRGHTKNACDRTFNQMKLKYHKKDVFTWSQAIETLNIKDNVRMIDAQESMFKDYGAMLGSFYGNFKSATIQKNHIFRVEDTDKTLSMQCALHSDAPFIPQPMLKRGHVLGPSRTAKIEAYIIETLTPPGLRPIKQVELWKKFRPFVPRQYWDELCPRPSDEVIAQVKDDTAQKRKHKVAKKAATATPLVVAETATPLVVAATATPLVVAATATPLVVAATVVLTKRRTPKRNAMVMAEAAVARAAPKRRKAAVRASKKATKKKAASGSDSDWTE
jgi:hypothetical protein